MTPNTTPVHATVPNGPNTRHIRIVGYTVALTALLADLVTKWWALNTLTDGRRIPILGDYLSFILLLNPGAAFSLGDNVTLVFTLLATVFSIALIALIWRTHDITQSILYALLLGGALGNLYDRLFSPPSFGRGHVIDFIDYNGYFVGNVADIWIVIAVALLFIHAIRNGEKQ